MGMSTHIEAFMPDTDETYQKMKKVYLACEEAQMELPEAAQKYFGTNYPEDEALDRKLAIDLKLDVHYTEYNADMVEGFEVDLTKLPKGITKLRFTNRY